MFQALFMTTEKIYTKEEGEFTKWELALIDDLKTNREGNIITRLMNQYTDAATRFNTRYEAMFNVAFEKKKYDVYINVQHLEGDWRPHWKFVDLVLVASDAPNAFFNRGIPPQTPDISRMTVTYQFDCKIMKRDTDYERKTITEIEYNIHFTP